MRILDNSTLGKTKRWHHENFMQHLQENTQKQEGGERAAWGAGVQPGIACSANKCDDRNETTECFLNDWSLTPVSRNVASCGAGV